MKVALVSSGGYASERPIGFGLPRRLMLVILIYRLSLIVVRRETRNLLFPYLACRKKAEEARAFPGFLRIDI
jgi:hypothetical protein